jgi:hypothetical protein
VSPPSKYAAVSKYCKLLGDVFVEWVIRTHDPGRVGGWMKPLDQRRYAEKILKYIRPITYRSAVKSPKRELVRAGCVRL